MNRVITGRLGIFSFLVALFAAGCAVEQASESADQQQGTEDSDMSSADSAGAARGLRGAPVVVHGLRGNENGACLGCGPLPEPWEMGPLPEPWTSSSGGSSGVNSSSSSSGANGGGGTSSGNGKP